MSQRHHYYHCLETTWLGTSLGLSYISAGLTLAVHRPTDLQSGLWLLNSEVVSRKQLGSGVVQWVGVSPGGCH